VADPENMVLHLLREMREDIRRIDEKVDGVRAEMATKQDLAEVKAELQSEIKSLRADVASDFLTYEQRMNDQFTTLRRAVMEYHSTAVGHGMLYTELEERVRKIEQRLDMTPAESH
jgi:phage shock protein A